jgi:hypothetical protein
MSEKISFICIDKRYTDPKTNQTYIVLENTNRVIMPPNVHSVPALLLIKQNYKIILGDDILKHYHPQMKELNERATNFNGEPMAFPIMSSSGGTNIVSEQFTLYDMTPEELSAKGKGNNRQLYNYVSTAEEFNLIQTPPDTYRPDKLSNSVTIDTLQQQRMDEVAKIAPKQQFTPLNI